MITVELYKPDIIHMIKGISPSYDQMKKLEYLKQGSYTGGFADKWDWSSNNSKCWDQFSTQELFNLYLELTHKR